MACSGSLHCLSSCCCVSGSSLSGHVEKRLHTGADIYGWSCAHFIMPMLALFVIFVPSGAKSSLVPAPSRFHVWMCFFAQVVTTWDSKASDRNADACSNLEPRLREVVCILAPWFGAHAFVPCISVQVVAQRQDLISELLQKLRQEAAEANDGSQ